jgi:hypothetical protein
MRPAFPSATMRAPSIFVTDRHGALLTAVEGLGDDCRSLLQSRRQGGIDRRVDVGLEIESGSDTSFQRSVLLMCGGSSGASVSGCSA